MKRPVILSTLAAGLAGGSVLGAITFAPALTSAQQPTPTPTTQTAPADRAAEHKARLSTALQPLVDAGTITSAQRDAVVEQLGTALPGKGDGGERGMRGGASLEAAATAIGITAEELRTALDGGQTIAQVAGSKGVAVQKVIDAIVAAESARIDQAVTGGKMTAEEAAAKKAELAQRIADMVNGVRPAMPERGVRPTMPDGAAPRGPRQGGGS